MSHRLTTFAFLLCAAATSLAGELPETARLAGSYSCSAAACHGSQLAHTRWANARGDEFILWIDRDPHARAGTVLANERSRQILERLGTDIFSGGQLACVGCHAPLKLPHQPSLPNPKIPDAPPAAGLLGEGVGCESCHGPAAEWLASHFRVDPTNLDGWVDTDNLLTRARQCAECHIGSANREVNHDLIAAGHPALRFEYASYYQALPKHWHDEDRQRSDYFERMWAAGQIASAEAALALVEARARRASDVTSPGVWPEFADYACFDCHRSLSPTQTASPGRIGIPSWNRSRLALLTQHLSQEIGEPGRSFAKSVAALQSKIDIGIATEANEVLPIATDSRHALRAWLNQKGQDAAIAELAAAASRLGESLQDVNSSGIDLHEWESAAQVYSLAAILAQARRQRRELSLDNGPPLIDDLQAARKNLIQWFELLNSDTDGDPRHLRDQFSTEIMSRLPRHND